MSCLILRFILILLVFWAFLPHAHAQGNARQLQEPIGMTNFVQALPPIVIDVSWPSYLVEKTPALRPQYLYDSDWTKVIRDGGYLRSAEEEYFKETRRNILYGYSQSGVKKVWQDEEEFLNDRDILRERWRDLLGFDLFYPYYKAKQMEKWVKERFSVKLFGMKGRPQFSKNRIMYVFKTTF
jgi:hypothetical protein